MDCATWQRWFSPYVDGLLAPAERAQLEEHLRGCARCQGDLQSLTQMLAALRAMERPDTPELLPGIHQRLQRRPWWRTAAERFLAPWPVSLPWHGLALATSALLVIVLVIIPSYRLKRSTDEANSFRDIFQESQLSPHASQLPSQAGWVKKRKTGLTRAVAGAPLLEGQLNQSIDTTTALREGLRYQEADTRDTAQSLLPGRASAPSGVVADRLPSGEEGHYFGSGLEAGGHTPLEDEHRSFRYNRAMLGAVVAGAPAPRALAITPSVLEVQWSVKDLLAAVTQVTEWVQERQGWCVATNEHHLAISLPAAEVPQFLQQFTSLPSGSATPPEPFPAVWVSISLELIPSE